MLSWWDAEGSLDRVIEPLISDLHQGELKPVVAEAFPFDRAPASDPTTDASKVSTAASA
jgi:NADPH:quinone reductase-like Zn-dependent oxidoreductase